MNLNRSDFGFWKNAKDMPAGQLIGIEGIFALILGGLGCGLLIPSTKIADRVVIAGDFLTLIGALLGVMVAAFALVITLFSDSYLLQLKTHPSGVRIFLAPFVVNIGFNVGAVIGAVAYRSTASHLPATLEQSFFVAIGTMFVFVLLKIVAISRNVLAHGVTRAEVAEIEQMQRMIDKPNRDKDL
ncbi:hypothetical protein GCM10027187_02360 [Streptosporangium sandarakinum]|uniref:Uncharacterized protein n=1 Tax=Streptosporangium sandarakinum TaxID=1260955 RepID=A0A852UW51_9ACTN|nr:hypothetical protein [Streptosporangium sandarakinum]NYF40449.1 hypothetical protein [Streptosporangium sandarakinum]